MSLVAECIGTFAVQLDFTGGAPKLSVPMCCGDKPILGAQYLLFRICC